MTTRHILPAALLLLAPIAARAQGALSTQGLGYPPGQLSTRAAATGGALGEFDALTPLNPAALEASTRSMLFAQYDPEFRRVTAGGRSASTTTSRFPLLGGMMRVGERAAIGVTASTLLDRSWRTTIDTVRVIDGDSVRTTESFSSLGSITDLRLGGSWQLTRAVRLGAGVHGYTGEHRLNVSGTFGDSTELELANESVSFGGIGFSAGAVVRLGTTLSVAGSARKGGTIKARRDNEVIASAGVPDRLGVGVRYTGISGTALAANLDWTSWTRLDDLVSSRTKLFDALNAGVGADVAGPRIGERTVTLRGGARWRTLPFGLGETEVKELGLSLGAGIPLARERAALDLGVTHARRSAGDEASERAWILSVGFSVRP